MQNDHEYLISTVRAKIQITSKWGERFWHIHQTLSGIGLTGSLLVPFGLALLLYIPNDVYNRQINVFLLFVSALSLASQLLDNTQRYLDRSRRLRTISYELQTGLVKFQEGIIDNKDLVQLLEQFSTQHAGEESP